MDLKNFEKIHLNAEKNLDIILISIITQQ